MFRLTNKLAVSNLIKNRKLYYPFALAVLLAVTITYLFYSLTFNPKIAEIRGGTTIQATLGFGMFVVTLASAIIVLYANSFVMKNRSKELGIYGMLGLEKRHLKQHLDLVCLSLPLRQPLSSSMPIVLS
ncbi:ABC transporter, membrane-spanning protein [Streptococcus pneumoniae]|nr:ABC transporter, membrane-spanning protein [Streptococcus pneumoniae]